MKPKADPVAAVGDAAAGTASEALVSFAPFKDKLSNILAAAAAATGGVGAGAGDPAFMNPKADLAPAGAAAGVVGVAAPPIKSSKLSFITGAGGAGGAATGAAVGVDAICKPPNKFPPPVAGCAGFGGDCWGGGGGAAGAGAGGVSSKSSKLATGGGGAAAGGAATGAAVCPTGCTTFPTGVATPSKFKTRLAGSRMAARVWLARGANSPLHACRKSA
mmetsp:Transcript_26129/g.71665  ORF Transcript_26129/g.71665 Transcript_26129/m.71665 type:complete len:218 (-) Transcript_26129:1681-2334(-)